MQALSPAWRGFFPHLTDNFYLLGKLFSDLASENSQLLAALANVFSEKLIHTSATKLL
jgi:hypothetical protein